MITGLQAITKALKSATSRWEAVKPAFLKLPEGQVVVVHLLVHGQQMVGRMVSPEDINMLPRSIPSSGCLQILGYYRFIESTWELASDLIFAIEESKKDAPMLFEEELLERLLAVAEVRDDLVAPVPEGMEEFFLHRVGTEQAIVMAPAEEDIFNVPEHPLGRLIAPKGTVARYWPAIEMERETKRKARNLIDSLFTSINESSHEETDERTRSRFRRTAAAAHTEPAPGMGASESKDRGEPPYVPASLAGTRRGQAGKDLG